MNGAVDLFSGTPGFPVESLLSYGFDMVAGFHSKVLFGSRFLEEKEIAFSLRKWITYFGFVFSSPPRITDSDSFPADQ